jgi:acyl-CoA reductase-like NAD-dependent aldehyde dehydrogenase
LKQGHSYSHTIGGAPVTSRNVFEVVNPAHAEAFAIAPAGGALEVDAAVRAALAAFPAWTSTPHDLRVHKLLAFADRIDAEKDMLARLLTMEQGKPLARAEDEIGNATKYLRKLVQLPMGPDRLTASDGRQVEIHHRSLGVIAAITPWNVPVLLAIWKIGHALVTGNTMVLKPAPTTPLTSLCLGEIGRETLPPGVLNVVSGGNEVGEAMVTHPDVAKISFTGSVAVGRKIGAAAASALKRVTLELGGNDAAIVLDDADVDTVAPAVFAAAFTNAGQACMAIKRLYVHESRFDSFVRSLRSSCDQLVVGNGLDEGVQMGPIQNRRQYESVQSVLQEAEGGPVEFYAGKRPVPGRGYFLAPHIAINPPAGMRVVQEETFGPVLPVISYKTVEEAVAAANGTSFGLSGSVWTSDWSRGKQVVAQLEVGSAWINKHVDYDAHVPFGGMKMSGIGRENSIFGLRHYTEMQAIYG